VALALRSRYYHLIDYSNFKQSDFAVCIGELRSYSEDSALAAKVNRETNRAGLFQHWWSFWADNVQEEEQQEIGCNCQHPDLER